jgi:hypothetical protein
MAPSLLFTEQDCISPTTKAVRIANAKDKKWQARKVK